MDDEALSKALADLNLEDGLGLDRNYQNLGVDCDTLDKLEYIRNPDDSAVKAKEDKWLDPEEDSSEEDEDWSWMEPLIQEDRENFEEETFFCTVHYDRKPMKKGEQAFISYGGRTNFFLLQSYGFCFVDNYYESFKFYVKLDLVTGYNQNRTFSIKDMIAATGHNSDIQEIRLKLD